MFDWQEYSDDHSHLTDPGRVEVVAYQRKAGGWGVFVCSPLNSCPELEAGRVDDEYILIETVADITDFDRVAQDIHRRLGPAYDLAVYFRESGGRRTIGRIYDHLRRCGADRMWVRAAQNASDDWELVIRRKDFERAAEIEKSNVEVG